LTFVFQLRAEIKIPEIVLMHGDRPEFDKCSGIFKVTDRYITFVKKDRGIHQLRRPGKFP
jgi:hypothetical protein